jgi:hypothetical protein
MIDQQSTWMDSPATLRVAKVTRRQRTIHDIFALALRSNHKPGLFLHLGLKLHGFPGKVGWLSDVAKGVMTNQ